MRITITSIRGINAVNDSRKCGKYYKRTKKLNSHVNVVIWHFQLEAGLDLFASQGCSVISLAAEIQYS